MQTQTHANPHAARCAVTIVVNNEGACNIYAHVMISVNVIQLYYCRYRSYIQLIVHSARGMMQLCAISIAMFIGA